MNLFLVDGDKTVSQFSHLDLVSVHQYDIGRLEDLDVVPCGAEIGVSTETLIVDRHFSVKDGLADDDGLVRVDYLLR